LTTLSVGKVQRQAPQVVQRGAAPAIDRLVVVAHRGEAGARADQQLQHFILRGIGVLVFVHQHVAELRLPLLAHFRMVAQQLQRQADQVVEVHALVGGQPLLVAGHDARGHLLVVVLRLGFRLRRVKPGVLPQADGPLPLPRRGRVGGAAGVLEQAGHVVAVQDRELRLQAQGRAVLAQHPHAQGVEGTDQHALCLAADQALGPLAHFGRGLVSEGDGGDALGFQPGLDQAADLVRDDPGLAGPGAGQHQAGPLHVIDSFLLGEVEACGH
jgi:hypothetical protein